MGLRSAREETLRHVAILPITALLISLSLRVAAAEPTAEFPSYAVGDTWTIERSAGPNTDLKLVAIENNLMVMTGFQQCPQCRAYLDRNLAPIKLLDEAGKPLSSARGLFSWGYPGWKYLDWPLTPNKTWRIEADGLFNNQVLRYTIDITVLGVEEVETKAGTFEAFKISRKWQSGKWQMSETLWWSSTVKWYVKRTGDKEAGWELKSFTVK